MTSTINLIDRIKLFRQLWQIVMPHIQVPTAKEAAYWIPFPDGCVEAAIVRTSQKFAATKMRDGFKPEAAYRYATSVARENAERKETRLARVAR